jgi:hypothetical protein
MEMEMRRSKITLTMLMIAGSLTGSALAANGIIMKQRLSDENYCHMQFSAIDPGTLASQHPRLKDSSSGDVVDFYGSCDESPTGRDQVIEQRLEESRHNPASNH